MREVERDLAADWIHEVCCSRPDDALGSAAISPPGIENAPSSAVSHTITASCGAPCQPTTSAIWIFAVAAAVQVIVAS